MILLKSVEGINYSGNPAYEVVYEFRPTTEQQVNGMTMGGVNRCVCENLLEDAYGISLQELKEAFPEKFI